MVKKTSRAAKQFAKQVLKTSKKKKKKERVVSRKVTFDRALKELETKVERKEEDYIAFLQNRIKELEQELRISEKTRQEEITLNKMKIDSLYSAMDNLRERIARLAVSRTARQRRVEEIERRVKERAVGIDIHKVLEMENQLKLMQEKYEKLEKQKKYSPASLTTAKIAIESLRQKIAAKKREAIPAVEPSVEMPAHKKLIPSERKPTVRHAMKFEMPAPKKGVPAEEIKPELSALPSMKEMPKPSLEEFKVPKVPAELVKKPKRTFGQKLRIVLFGKPKPKFKGLK